MPQSQLILASTSPWRQSLLQSSGLSFSIFAPAVDESTLSPLDPFARAKIRAEAKGAAVAASATNSYVIGADQVLGFQGRAYDKVETRAEARARLQEFQGGTHQLISAFCLYASPDLAAAPALVHSEIVTVDMEMRALSAAELEAYLDLGEWQGCVGCYRYEARGINLFSAVHGESSAIIGLPLPQLLGQLRRVGFNPLLA